MQNTIKIHPGQLFRSNIQSTIDSKDVKAYDMHYRVMDGSGNKSTVYLSDYEMSIDSFIDTAENYGSFWLFITYKNGAQTMFQIVSDQTGEPL